MTRKIFPGEDIVYQVPKAKEAIGLCCMLMVRRIGNYRKGIFCAKDRKLTIIYYFAELVSGSI